MSSNLSMDLEAAKSAHAAAILEGSEADAALFAATKQLEEAEKELATLTDKLSDLDPMDQAFDKSVNTRQNCAAKVEALRRRKEKAAVVAEEKKQGINAAKGAINDVEQAIAEKAIAEMDAEMFARIVDFMNRLDFDWRLLNNLRNDFTRGVKNPLGREEVWRMGGKIPRVHPYAPQHLEAMLEQLYQENMAAFRGARAEYAMNVKKH